MSLCLLDGWSVYTRLARPRTHPDSAPTELDRTSDRIQYRHPRRTGLLDHLF